MIENAGNAAAQMQAVVQRVNIGVGSAEKIAQLSEESSTAAAESSSGAQQLDRLAKEMLNVVSTYQLS